MTGVKAFLKKALSTEINKFTLSIGVIWRFAGDASCSDYISINCSESDNMTTVNYGSQDYWIGLEGYRPWGERMSKLLGVDFPMADLQ
jgi:hypothetical protein